MRIIVLSNDVIPGFDVPVAAPGLRAAGIAEGLRAHGHEVTVAVPGDLLAQLFGPNVPPAPPGARVVAPPAFMALIDEVEPAAVVFINANLTPHLHPREDVHFIYDLFAPKVLELEASIGLSSSELDQRVMDLTSIKARALGLANAVWVNGARKVNYAHEWLGRDDVAKWRSELGTGLAVDVDVTVVDMAVPLPHGVQPSPERTPLDERAARLGIAGYAQQWSTLNDVHPGHQRLVDAGHELHALLPGHWGGNPDSVPTCALPNTAVRHAGPLAFAEFAEWVQSMDAMVDVFAPSPERRFAMITRSAVALRLGVPLIHAVDSEISDIVAANNAGWVLDPSNEAEWQQVVDELADPAILAAKANGARHASLTRFAPDAALRLASERLGDLA